MALNANDLSNFDLLSNLQGNILKGHGREHTTHIFILFDGSRIAQAKRWIAHFADTKLVSMQKQLKQREVFKQNKIPGGLFASFYLTKTGYDALSITAPTDASFIRGMKHPDTKNTLNDPDKTAWEEGYQEDIHAMILLAHESVDEMGRIALDMIDELDKFSRIALIEYGHAIKNENGDGIEHFGYVDGVSQPLFLQDEVDASRNGKKAEDMQWDAEAPLELVLVPDTITNDPTAFGSYFVYRKLEQRVKAFNEAEEKLADRLGLKDDDKERAGAMLVGRFEDGTPVTMIKTDGMIGSGAENNFDYRADPAGAKCPFHAHIRKTNPRGTGGFEDLAGEKKHIMARRGIPFGMRNVNTSISPSIPQMPADGVGLLFMSYQANLASQFEFIQSAWVNNDAFPRDTTGTGIKHGSDPILGQGIVSKGKFAKTWGDETTLDEQRFENFVQMKGGEYFFTPSVKFLKTITEIPVIEVAP